MYYSSILSSPLLAAWSHLDRKNKREINMVESC